MSKITKVVSRQIFDSRGIPTIETEIFCGKVSSKAICPSGASTGSYEAFEKRDVTNKKYLGKSVFSAVSNVNKIISKKILNKNVHNQELIDSILIRLDGTKQKNKLGANAILSVSIAVKKLSAKLKKIPLYKNFLIKKNFAIKIVSIFFLIPTTSALMAWFFLKESLTAIDLLGFLITSIGVYIATRD